MEGYMANDSKFSSPMPAVGLFIAGATLVCLVFMLSDIYNAIRQRKPWVPCRFFVLNSFTLTLLSTSTKLTRDFTTSMPSAWDQLSKLCGTSLICISIGFFRPSIVNMSDAELSASMGTLTVMVLSAVVNVSLQISTGAIFLFKVEHVIIMVVMILLLGVMGCFKFRSPDYLCEPFRKSIKHMPRNILTLKRCYIHSYITDPQLMLCRFSQNATVGILCTTCFVVFSEAAIRAFSQDQGGFKGGSNYKWSIGAVVGLQILTLVVGILAVIFRCLSLASQIHTIFFIGLKTNTILECRNISLLILRNWIVYSKVPTSSGVISQIFRMQRHVVDSFLFLMRICLQCVNNITLIAIRVVWNCFSWSIAKIGIIGFLFSEHKVGSGAHDDDDDDKVMVILKKEFGDDGLKMGKVFIPDFYSDYLVGKSVMDMKMCINKHSAYPMHALLKFLQQSTHCSTELSKQISKSSDELLLLVCLVRIADSLVPSFRYASMACALDEAFEILIFVHEKTKIAIASTTLKINFAKDIWMSKGINNHWFHTNIIKHLKKGGFTNRIWDRIPGLLDKFLVNYVFHEVYDIINIIDGSISRLDGHLEELYDRIEHLFAELLHKFIDQLPNVIFNSLNESTRAVEYQENVKTSMKLIARLNLVEADSLRAVSSSFNSFMATDETENEREQFASSSLVNESSNVDQNLGFPTTHGTNIAEVI
ncbi:hypothetical protein Sjap_008890 [Stephania japonica]|uniref:Uncharacterized protein n=1 Tax=Stephania japonica TaxID=461633 RepID=A0AAP0PEX5_9MAGN